MDEDLTYEEKVSELSEATMVAKIESWIEEQCR